VPSTQPGEVTPYACSSVEDVDLAVVDAEHDQLLYERGTACGMPSRTLWSAQRAPTSKLEGSCIGFDLPDSRSHTQ